MDWENRRLNQHASHHKAKTDIKRRPASDIRQAVRYVAHIQCAGDGIDKPDTNHIKGRANRANHKIMIASNKRPPVSTRTHTNQNHRSQGRNFKENKQIESISCHHKAKKPTNDKKPCRIEFTAVLKGNFNGNKTPCGQRCQKPEARHHHQCKAGSRINDKFNAPRRFPIAKMIANANAIFGYGLKHQGGKK